MYFAGVDLAWAGRNPTGLAVVDADGSLVSVSAVRGDEEILAALRPYTRGDCLVAFDAPLVVTNPTGQRPAEAALNRDFRRSRPVPTRPTPENPSSRTGPVAGAWRARSAWSWTHARQRPGAPSRCTRTPRRSRCSASSAR